MWRVDYSIRINIEEIIRRQCGMESTLRRTWAEIDLDALAHNYHKLRERIGADVKFLGVVKADAYGHGSVQVSHLLQELGADYLAVSSIDEAVELRLNDVTMPILILGHTPKEQVSRLIEYHITQAVSCEAKALEYSEEAVKCGGILKIHIKVDTGMSRLGYLCDGDHLRRAWRESVTAARCQDWMRRVSLRISRYRTSPARTAKIHGASVRPVYARD